jgi:hypothetical protein
VNYNLLKCYNISEPFEEIPVNDAQISPNGLFAVFVGDHGGIWISKVIYERLEEVDACMETDSDNWEVIDEDEDVFIEDTGIQTDDPQLANNWKFSEFKKVSLVGFHSAHDQVSMQYASWSCDSRYVAITSDSSGLLIIMEVTERNFGVIRKVLNFGHSTLAVTFHPRIPTLLAFGFRNSYVFIVDISELSRSQQSNPEPDFPYQVLELVPLVSLSPNPTRVGTIKSTDASVINGLKWTQDGSWLYIGKSVFIRD